MPNLLQARMKATAVAAAVLAAFVLFTTSVACAAFSPSLAAPTHPCCPTQSDRTPERCVGLRCVAAEAVIVTINLGAEIDLPPAEVLASSNAASVERMPAAGLFSSLQDRVLIYRQLLI